MKNTKLIYNPETAIRSVYTEVWVTELVKMKDETRLQVKHHYWRDSDGELWGDFEHPMENVQADFNAYRENKQYMQPTVIIALRQRYQLSVRALAQILGIGASTLSQIENNERLQTGYQDALLRLIEVPAALSHLVSSKQTQLDTFDVTALTQRLQQLSVS